MCASMSHPGEGCIDPMTTNVTASVISTKDGVQAQFGNDVTYHWMVPTGRHTYRSKVVLGQFWNLSEPTTLHYATAHLHPLRRIVGTVRPDRATKRAEDRRRGLPLQGRRGSHGRIPVRHRDGHHADASIRAARRIQQHDILGLGRMRFCICTCWKRTFTVQRAGTFRPAVG